MGIKTQKNLWIILLSPLKLTLTGCAAWIKFDAYRLIILFVVSLVIGIIGLISFLFKDKTKQ